MKENVCSVKDCGLWLSINEGRQSLGRDGDDNNEEELRQRGQ